MINPRRKTATQVTVSLFPFLAVLLCTMGSLLVLLVVMARQARVRAANVRDEKHLARAESTPQLTAESDAPTVGAHDVAAMNAELEALRERIVQIDEMQTDGQSRLDAAQMRLGHAESHMQRLQRELAAYYADADTIGKLGATRLADIERAEKELERLTATIRDTESEVETLRKNASKTPKSFAIVPYQGPNGTHRRPIYIECRNDAVVIQPEGVAFTANDFRDPIGPGNPLATAIRAAKEFHAESNTATTGDAAAPQPYPLLLVRPDGILAYYHAREAIASWGPEFGYEMIDGDWDLEMPPADPRLAHVLHRAVETSRARQRALAEAAPRRFHGGTAGGDGSRGSAGGAAFAVDADQLPDDGFGGDPGDNGYANVSGPQSSPTMNQAATTQAHGQTAAGRNQNGVNGTSDGAPNGENGGAENSNSVGEEPLVRHDSNGPGGSSSIGADRTKSQPTRISSQTARDQSGQESDTAVSVDSASRQARSSAASEHHQQSAGRRGENDPSITASGSSARFGAASSMSQGGNVEQGPVEWPNANPPRDAAPIRRPVQIVVRSDRFAMLPEPSGAGKVVIIQGNMNVAVAELAAALRTRMNGWGIAGTGLYWKPTLILTAAPDGEANTRYLIEYLNGQGVEFRVSHRTADSNSGVTNP